MHADRRDDGFPLAILAKAPIPGRVKTRLTPTFAPAAAARLHEALLRQTLEVALAATPAHRIVLWTGLEHDHPLFVELAERHGISLRPQPEGNLGVRMFTALEAMGAPGLLVGSDCPVLTPQLLTDCHAALADHDGVLLPAEDGGYALVGLRQPCQAFFTDIDWGSDRVLAQTLARADSLGWRLAQPAKVWDVDRPADVARWQGQDASP
ncbi:MULTISPECIES: TIGR04282 family arsenosugar biosynthesis glycosyltransferase [Halomonadaceae]|uniref:TIGR04282 family arsenosugar biosynthesis glycosyltransferase n=1 Tax=Halomonadaceae TaxID=28256 RepID=UPI0015844693|nr:MULTISPECIES: TIGR04282 family arsenosugar biosynthesis glycosyltransferase [Halomonas]MDI4638039.1 TIGR04282 family arsenosugar biosynthesis glycosyltransferase [Halomonas sp. BMC7]NUJ59041.1 TIGR04282 family arsenosugar biosynthesis glycosyltransferase [Halomonas taeanensis]